MKLKQRLAKFMIGRYGIDRLTNCMLILSMVLLVVSAFLSGKKAGSILSGLAFALIVLGYARIFSRKTGKRYAENQAFMRLWNKAAAPFRALKEGYKVRKTHRVFRCPSCKAMVRVPKNVGKIRITCPHCKAAFVKKA